MLDHIGVNVPDLQVARRYYDALIPALGLKPFIVTDTQLSYRPAVDDRGTRIFFYTGDAGGTYSRFQTGLQHLAFRVATRRRVDEVHAKAIELGSEVIRAPRLLPKYHRDYYATYWYDPFDIMLEAVCHEAE